MSNAAARTWRAAIITVSDRCARGQQPDDSGELLAERLAQLPARIVFRRTVPDEPSEIGEAVLGARPAADILVLTGGTGLSPRDVTPQALRAILDYEIPGMGEAMRAFGARSTPYAMLSRQVCGVSGRALIIALPGSRKAVAESLAAIWEVLPHALELVAGDSRTHPTG